MVPEIIHQCHMNGWLGLCDEELEAISLNKESNPYWEHRFYSIENMRRFVDKYYGERIVNAFYSINPSYGAAIADPCL